MCSAFTRMMSPSFGEAEDITRFASGDHFAACNGTARSRCRPGHAKVYRLSRRGNCRIDHAVEAPRHLRPQRAV